MNTWTGVAFVWECEIGRPNSPSFEDVGSRPERCVLPCVPGRYPFVCLFFFSGFKLPKSLHMRGRSSNARLLLVQNKPESGMNMDAKAEIEMGALPRREDTGVASRSTSSLAARKRPAARPDKNCARVLPMNAASGCHGRITMNVF